MEKIRGAVAQVNRNHNFLWLSHDPDFWKCHNDKIFDRKRGSKDTIFFVWVEGLTVSTLNVGDFVELDRHSTSFGYIGRNLIVLLHAPCSPKNWAEILQRVFKCRTARD